MRPAEPDADYDQDLGQLRLSGPGFYLTIRIAPGDLLRLSGAGDASWDDRGSIAAGEMLGHHVFWCRSATDPAAVTVLVGADDETWELAVEVTADVLLRTLPS